MAEAAHPPPSRQSRERRMRRARPIWLVSFFLAALCQSPVLAEEPGSFAGKYAMRGKGYGAEDRAYAGTCALDWKDGFYAVSCFNEDTRHTYSGKGLAAGKVLAILIGDTLRGDHNEIYAGEYLVVYERGADGTLGGTWVHAPGPARGAETLTPIR
jgi:hypothetical protein